jgi:hypothetical protein
MNVIPVHDLPFPVNKKSGLQDLMHARKIVKSDYYFRHFHLSVRIELDSHWTDFY